MYYNSSHYVLYYTNTILHSHAVTVLTLVVAYIAKDIIATVDVYLCPVSLSQKWTVSIPFVREK
jgi:hypothetical protein